FDIMGLIKKVAGAL
uniref:Eumenine mastoparan-ER n=1 Tax=Eumenes rubrofemoratus TaxID=1035770 RepID=MASTE_EUMRB|nr:RecName: Full=Eumenine mastoparan-ER; Short=EMP-ER [Eumenes rubrofemoratus]